MNMTTQSVQSAQSTQDDQDLAPKKNRIKLLLILAIVLVPLIGFAGGYAYLSTLDGDWLKPKLTAFLAKKYKADATIEKLEFDPLSGFIQAEGVSLKRDSEKEKLDAELKTLQVKVSVLPLLFARLNAKTIYINEGDITVVKAHSDKPEVQQKVKIGAVSQTKKIVNGVHSVFKVLFKDLPVGVEIDQLDIKGVTVDATITKKDADPLKLKFSNFEYKARGIKARKTIDFLSAADWQMGLDVNGKSTSVKRVSLTEPRLFEVNAFDLGAVASKDPGDAIWLEKGFVDLRLEGAKDKADVKLNLTGLKLSQNTASEQKAILFVPVDKIVSHVNSREKISLGFDRDQKSLSGTDDLDAMTTAVWQGFLEFLVKEIGKETVQDPKKFGGMLKDKWKQLKDKKKE